MDGFDSSSKFLVSCKFALILCEPQMYLVGAELHFHVLISQRSRIYSVFTGNVKETSQLSSFWPTGMHGSSLIFLMKKLYMISKSNGVIRFLLFCCIQFV